MIEAAKKLCDEIEAFDAKTRIDAAMTDPTFTIEICGFRREADGGGKIPAIKELRRMVPGLGLRESKDMVEASEVRPKRIDDATREQARFMLGCKHLKGHVLVFTAQERAALTQLRNEIAAIDEQAKTRVVDTPSLAPSPGVEQIWREVYVAALTTLLHYTDKPSAEAKRLADQAVADYRSALEQTPENS